MATINQNTVKPDENNGQNGAAPASAPSSATPAVQVVGGQGGTFGSGGAAPAQANQPTSSGQWTNLQSYLNANKDYNANNGGLSGQVKSGIQTADQQVKDNADVAKNEFNNESQANANQWNMSGDRAQSYQNAITNPTAATDQDIQNVATLRNASYGGPQDLNSIQGPQNLTALSGQAQNVQDMASQAGTEEGRFNLLKQMFGGNQYSQGEQKLDNLLLQADPNQAQSLSQARQYGADAQTAVNNSNLWAQNQASNLNSQAKQLGTDTTSKFTGMASGVQDNVNNDITRAKLNASNLMNDLSSRTLTPDEAKALGISTGQGTYGLNLDPNSNAQKIYNKDYYNSANAANVATQDEYNQYNALAKLAGIQNTFLPGQYDPSHAYDPTKAVNVNNLQTALTNSQRDYNTYMQQMDQNLTNLIDPDNKVSLLGSTLGWKPSGMGSNSDYMWNTYNMSSVPYDMTTASGVQQFMDATGRNNPIWQSQIGPSGESADQWYANSGIDPIEAQAQALLDLINSNKTFSTYTPPSGPVLTPGGVPVQGPGPQIRPQ